jgi:hypothetical protein
MSMKQTNIEDAGLGHTAGRVTVITHTLSVTRVKAEAQVTCISLARYQSLVRKAKKSGHCVKRVNKSS